jgi:hypothetical protein
VTAVNLDTGTISWTARSPVSGYAPLVSPDGRTVYAVGLSADPPAATVYRIRAATGTLRGPVIPAVRGASFFTARGRVDWVIHLRDGGDLLLGRS